MTWEITRIARCGGLNELNRKQRRDVRESLQVMYQNGGKIREHGCFTNAPLLSLMDFVHRDGRIIACDGTVDNSPHGWCEIDNKPFEIAFPLVIATEASARRFLAEQGMSVLRDIRKSFVKSFKVWRITRIKSKKHSRGGSGLSLDIAILHRAFSFAIENEMIEKNPVRLEGRPGENPEGGAEPFSSDELLLLRKHAESDLLAR